MRVRVPEGQIAQLGVQEIDIGQLNAGPLSIGTLVLTDTHLGIGTGSAELVNLRVTVSVEMSLAWRVTVKIPLVDDWTWSGDLDLGAKSIRVQLGDVTCPGLDSLDVDLPSLTIDNVTAALGPIRHLHLGALVAEQIAARDAVLPVPDFQVTGLGVGRVQVAGASVPAGTVGSTAIERVSGQAFPVGTVTIPGLDLPEMTIDDVSSDAVDVEARSNVIRQGADLGVLDVTLSLSPTVRTQLDQLRLSNVRSTGSIASVEMRDVVLPYEALGVTLSQIGIHDISVPTIEVS